MSSSSLQSKSLLSITNRAASRIFTICLCSSSGSRSCKLDELLLAALDIRGRMEVKDGTCGGVQEEVDGFFMMLVGFVCAGGCSDDKRVILIFCEIDGLEFAYLSFWGKKELPLVSPENIMNSKEGCPISSVFVKCCRRFYHTFISVV